MTLHVRSAAPKSIVAPTGITFVAGRTFASAAAFDRFAKGKTLSIRPGQSFTINLPSRETHSFMRGLNKNSPFTIVISKDIPTSKIIVGARATAKPMASDNLSLQTFERPQVSSKPPDLKTDFKLLIDLRVY